MDKNYLHRKYETNIYKIWEKSSALTPKISKQKSPFSIIMPPPNASDPLHIGHARFVVIEDVLARYMRMKGLPTLWLPGADHAGIETQYIFEKHLARQGKSRFDYDQDTLFKMIWDFVVKNTHIMQDQLKKLGSSCDWSRFKFTLDPEIVKIVQETFKQLYDEGLIYRGERLVNYCPKCGTNFSELEVNHQEQEGQMYYLDYGPVTIATTRPETIFADVAVAINPKDKVMSKLIGQKAMVPLIKREVPIIADSLVDPGFGTGALKITPGHDQTDFEIGQKHKLPIITVIDQSGKMINTPAKYISLKVNQARKEVLTDLEKAGKLEKIKRMVHMVGTCYRCQSTIEPLISKQWFLKVAPLVKKSLQAIKNKQVIFVSPRYEKIARHWLKNFKDWNISRQIVWGIRIPAWRCDKCLEWKVTAGTKPEKCDCGSEKLTQDTDTFDTWFSSGQWPYATLKTGAKNDFEYFYPTTVMETAYDIIPFWVVRMIMLGLYKTGKVPFKQVLIHGLVRDSQGQKISKSRGNVIDPIEMAEKYGADALRMGLVWGALIENDISLSEDNIRAQRNFANKLWNISRFVFAEKTKGQKTKVSGRPRAKTKADQEILKQLKRVTQQTTHAYEKYRLNDAAEILYQFVWHEFADKYLESVKSHRAEAQKYLDYVLATCLKLLHPLMPFITEAIWSLGYTQNKKDLLITASWPK